MCIKILPRGWYSWYSKPRHHIYMKYITIYTFEKKKENTQEKRPIRIILNIFDLTSPPQLFQIINIKNIHPYNANTLELYIHTLYIGRTEIYFRLRHIPYLKHGYLILKSFASAPLYNHTVCRFQKNLHLSILINA